MPLIGRHCRLGAGHKAFDLPVLIKLTGRLTVLAVVTLSVLSETEGDFGHGQSLLHLW